MGRISNCFEEHSGQFVNLLSKDLNHIVFMLHTRNAITKEQKLSILDSSPYSGIKKLFEYIEINEEILRTFIDILDKLYKTENGGIANFVQIAARYYFTSEPLKSLSFEIGTDVVLSCEVSDEYGVQWFKNEIEIQSNKKYNLRNNGLVHKLAILNAQPEDSGDYVCKCCYDRTECIIKADIKEIESLKNLEVVEGGSLQLTCTLNANVKVKWSRNGEELSRDIHTANETTEDFFFKYTLTIKNVKEEYSGEYNCLYENLKTSCYVIVQEKPIEDIISAGTTEILHEISDSKHKLMKKKEKINAKEVNLAEIETEIRTTEQEITAKEIETESKMQKLHLESNDLELHETEKYHFNDCCRKLREENAKLRENANMMYAELKNLKEERQKLEERVAVLEKYIDSANDKHQKTIEEMLAAQTNTIAELNEKHETTLEDIKKIINEREQSKTCAVS